MARNGGGRRLWNRAGRSQSGLYVVPREEDDVSAVDTRLGRRRVRVGALPGRADLEQVFLRNRMER